MEEGYGTQRVQLSEMTTASLEALAQQYNFTLNTLVLGAWALLLSRYSCEQDVIFGVTRTCRRSTLEGAESIVGLLINTLPFRVRVSPEQHLLSWLKGLRTEWGVIGKYLHSSLTQIQGWSDIPAGIPLFETLVVFEHYHLNATLRKEGGSWANRSFQLLQQTNYPLTVSAYAAPELVLEFGYDRRRFDNEIIRRMLGNFHRLLEGIADDPEGRISDLPLMTKSEWHRLLVEWNDTTAEYGHDQCIHQLVEAQVLRTPDTVAVVFGEQQLTYWELNRHANQLAQYLRKHGVGPETVVGIYMEPSLEILIGLLGILKAGGAYVPLDPTYPVERLAFMIEDIHVKALLTQVHLVGTLPDSHVHKICLDQNRELFARESVESPANQTLADNLAYVIYTSGSSGQPKGVMISHRSIGNRLLWGQVTYQLTKSDRILQKDSLSFDTSVWKFFGPLFVGARVIIAPARAHQDPALLVKLIGQHQITMTGWIPSALLVFLEEREVNTCRCLRHVLCGGEVFPLGLQDRFFACLVADLHNLYGPTEASIDATSWVCKRRSLQRTVPIGRPITNTQIYLLDGLRNPIPIGVPGELYISGIGLARGYLNRPDLTGERFMPNPFNHQPGARMYRTGDVARYFSDGNLGFLGRVDHQVKIRGFRIEPGEIEAVLEQHPAVREVVILAKEYEAKDHYSVRLGPGKHLVAYVVSDKESALTASDLRDFLKGRLPEYMVPTIFVTLDALPLTPNGKVNHQALPVPSHTGFELEESFVAPRTSLEELVAEIWREVLGVERVGIHDRFFELGGNSLHAMKIISRLRDHCKVEVPLHNLFDTPTVAGLAESMETFL